MLSDIFLEYILQNANDKLNDLENANDSDTDSSDDNIDSPKQSGITGWSIFNNGKDGEKDSSNIIFIIVLLFYLLLNVTFTGAT